MKRLLALVVFMVLIIALSAPVRAANGKALLLVPTPNVPGEWYIKDYPHGGSFRPEMWRNMIDTQWELVYDTPTGYAVYNAGVFSSIISSITTYIIDQIGKDPSAPNHKSKKGELWEQVDKAKWFKENWGKKLRPLDILDESRPLTHEEYWEFFRKSKTQQDFDRLTEHIEIHIINKYRDKASRPHRMLHDEAKKIRDKMRKEQRQNNAAMLTTIAIAIATLARKLLTGI